MNEDLINNFSLLQDYFRSVNDRGRVIAYGKAVSALRMLDVEITNVSQVKGVRGIGPKLRAKIKEYLDTGQIKAVEDKKELMKTTTKKTEKEQTIQEFTTIWGVGPAKAKSLYEKGMRSIDELEKNKNLLSTQQQIGLKYREDLSQKIPRKNITVLYTLFVYFLNKAYGSDNYKLKVAGSYRRGKTESGDVDCLITSKIFGLRDVVKLFQKKGIITDVLSMKGEKFMGVAHCPSGGQHIRLDIEFVPAESWGTALLYFTGSKGTNIYMRGIAKKKGYILNEHGIYNTKTGKKVVENPSEKDVFEILGLTYIPPERR